MAQTLLPPTKVSARAARTVKMASATADRSKNLSITTGGKISEKSVENLSIISSKLINVNNFLKDSLVLDKVKAGIAQKKAEQDLRDKREDDAEKDAPGKLKLPGQKFLKKANNWITKLIFGFLAIKLLDWLPTIKEWLPKIAAAVKWVFKWGGKLLDGLATFIDKGYGAVTKTQEWIKEKWGEGAEKKFTNMIGGLNKVMNGIFILGMTTAAFADALGGIDVMGLVDKLKRLIKNLLDKIPKITQRVTRSARTVSIWARRTIGPQARKVIKDVGPNLAKQSDNILKRVGDTKVVKAIRNIDPTKIVSKSKELALGGVKNIAKAGDFLFGRTFRQLGAAKDWVVKGTKSNWGKMVEGGKNLYGKVAGKLQKFGDDFAKLTEAGKKALMEKVLSPIQKAFEPLMKRVQGLGDTIFKQLQNIPGFNKLQQVLAKKGTKFGGGNLLKLIGDKGIPILGGIINLIFAYDRASLGDSVGALIEALSGAFDISGAFGFAPGPALSMGLDAYMFARDILPEFFPEADLKKGEDAAIDKLGLTGLKGQIDGMLKKLPKLDTITKALGIGVKEEEQQQGGNVNGNGNVNITSGSEDGSVVNDVVNETVGDGSNIAKNTQNVSTQSSAVSQSASYEGDTEGEVVFVPLPAKVIPVSGGNGETLVGSSSNGNGSVDGGELYIR